MTESQKFRGLQIKDNNKGTPRQPVPLRLIPFITELSVPSVLNFLTDHSNESNAPLIAYEYVLGNKPGMVNHHDILAIQRALPKATPSKIHRPEVSTGEIEAIPKMLFVWSNELINAVMEQHESLKSHPGYNRPHPTFNWSPALGDYRPLIAECPDFEEILPAALKAKGKQAQRTAETAAMYQTWCEERKRLKSTHHALGPTAIAKRIAKSGIGQGRDWSTIARKIRENCK